MLRGTRFRWGLDGEREPHVVAGLREPERLRCGRDLPAVGHAEFKLAVDSGRARPLSPQLPRGAPLSGRRAGHPTEAVMPPVQSRRAAGSVPLRPRLALARQQFPVFRRRPENRCSIGKAGGFSGRPISVAASTLKRPTECSSRSQYGWPREAFAGSVCSSSRVAERPAAKSIGCRSRPARERVRHR